MRYLLDTHIILWAITDDARLPQTAREIIEDRNNDIYYSAASVWEVAIKHNLHPDRMPFSGKELSSYCSESGYQSLSVREDHIFELEGLDYPDYAPKHNDPFDRIMISQAKADDMIFITHDSLIPNYGEKCIMSV
ncbi:MAG: type II toxin-antitoxin system VapC family toxin [Clostridiales bacterium]|nr:type II toxin-antitoxin system VapC family toxin [Clostridiales bacterium]